MATNQDRPARRSNRPHQFTSGEPTATDRTSYVGENEIDLSQDNELAELEQTDETLY
jgi:hypothetical protein